MRIRKLVKSERGLWEPEKLEEDVLGEIRQMLELNGALVFRSIERVPKCYRCGLWLGSSERGLSDLSGLYPFSTLFPIPFFLEVKRPKGGVKRAAQIDVINRVKTLGAIGGFVKSWDEVKALFAEKGIHFKIG